MRCVNSLRIGLIGSGFIAKFHLRALLAVRHAIVSAVYSPTAGHREALAREANALELGPCRAYGSLEAMMTSGNVDALWLLAPNFSRIATMREIHRLVSARLHDEGEVSAQSPKAPEPQGDPTPEQAKPIQSPTAPEVASERCHGGRGVHVTKVRGPA